MSIQRTPMTRPGYEHLREEVERLKKERPNIVRAIGRASCRERVLRLV